HVAQGDVEGVLGGPGQRLLAAAAGGDRESLLRQELGEGVADQRLVIDDQDVGGPGATLSPLAPGVRERGRGRGGRMLHGSAPSPAAPLSRSGGEGSKTSRGAGSGSARAIAGRQTRNAVPGACPGTHSTVPPWSASSLRVTNRPRPVPCF